MVAEVVAALVVGAVNDRRINLPANVRPAYLDALEGLRLLYERELRGAGIDYRQLDTSKPLDFALLGYLAARARRK